MIQQLNNSNFESTIKNNEVVLVDFYADWCGPCKALHPTLESLAQDFEGKAIISKINVDTNPELAQKFQVRAIPALFFFQNGELIERQAGAQTKASLSKNLNELVAV